MTRSLLAPALLASSLLAAAPAFAQQKVVPAQSEISFTSHQMGVPVDGKFRTWDAQISFDPKKPEAGKVSFTIDTGSATFGVPETDAEVPKAPWFNAAKFPKATFQSTAIKATGKGQYAVSGQLTVKGASQAVVVPVTLKQTGTTTLATGTFAIKRLDFKIGEGEWADTSTVANNVEVHFKLAVTGVGAL